MKKIFAIALCLCLLVTLVACSSSKVNEVEETTFENENVATDAGGDSSTSAPSHSSGTSGTPESPDDEDVIISEDQAPDFTVMDENGNFVKLSDFFGKPVVLNFWSSYCLPCRNEMPDFQKAYEKYGDGVNFVMVNYIGFGGETVESAKAFVNEQEYTFPIYFDTDHSAAATYGITSIPQTFFFNAKGELVTYAVGMIGEATLEQGIGMILE